MVVLVYFFSVPLFLDVAVRVLYFMHLIVRFKWCFETALYPGNFRHKRERRSSHTHRFSYVIDVFSFSILTQYTNGLHALLVLKIGKRWIFPG